MELKKKFIEAAHKKHPQYTEQGIGSCVLTAFMNLSELRKFFAKDLGNSQASKLAKIGGAVLVSELDETLENFPHLTADQVLRFFKTEALVNEDVLLDSTGITRPMLIELVEALEDYTGLRITDETDAPLRYLDERSQTLTIRDVAEYFSYSPSRIMSIQARSDRRCIPSMSAKTKACQRKVVQSYLSDCCDGKDVPNDLPIRQLHTQLTDSPYVIVHWMESRFGKVLDNKFIESKTVGEMLDFFAD